MDASVQLNYPPIVEQQVVVVQGTNWDIADNKRTTPVVPVVEKVEYREEIDTSWIYSIAIGSESQLRSDLKKAIKTLDKNLKYVVEVNFTSGSQAKSRAAEVARLFQSQGIKLKEVKYFVGQTKGVVNIRLM